MAIEVGVPVAVEMDGDDRDFSGVLPAGRYVTQTGLAFRLADQRGSAAADVPPAADAAAPAVGAPVGADLAYDVASWYAGDATAAVGC